MSLRKPTGIFKCLVVAGLVLLPRTVLGGDSWQFIPEVVNETPLLVGGGLRVEAPYDLLFSTSVGVMPQPYAFLVNKTAQMYGGYKNSLGDVIEDVLTDSLVFRGLGGWRPFPERPLYLELGYSVITLGGDADRDDILDAIGVIAPPNDPRLRFDTDSLIVMLNASVGWEWLLKDHFNIRASLGLAATIAADISIDPDPTAPDVVKWRVSQAEQAAEDALKDYGHLITLGIAIGYRP